MAERHLMQSNFGGSGSKSLYISIEASLKKLRMSYIDLLYVHFWDMATSTEEMMLSLNRLVTAGKALYLGISDTPTWFVVMCDDYARQHGLRPFSVYQGRWSAAERDFERDIIPMCIDQGMAPVPRGALGGGRFKLKSQPQQDGDGRKLTPSTARRAGWPRC
jgi:aryl-alcohol dehydrogenase-like predicted oxidoreductase